MKLQLALYDADHESAPGCYWSWQAPELSRSRLDDFFHQFARGHRPPVLAELGPADVWGGIVQLAVDQFGVYRFINGGRDSFGRLGREVLIVGFTSGEVKAPEQLLTVLTTAYFQSVCERAPDQRPIEAPAELEIDINDGAVDETVRQEIARLATLIRERSRSDTLRWHYAVEWLHSQRDCRMLPSFSPKRPPSTSNTSIVQSSLRNRLAAILDWGQAKWRRQRGLTFALGLLIGWSLGVCFPIRERNSIPLGSTQTPPNNHQPRLLVPRDGQTASGAERLELSEAEVEPGVSVPPLPTVEGATSRPPRPR